MKSTHPGVTQPCGRLHNNESRSQDFIRPTTAESETFLGNVHFVTLVNCTSQVQHPFKGYWKLVTCNSFYFAFCIQTPKGDWCKAREFKTQKVKVGSPDSVHCTQSKGTLLHAALWMGSPGWKHCFSNYVSVLWKWGWKVWVCIHVLAEIHIVRMYPMKLSQWAW